MSGEVAASVDIPGIYIFALRIWLGGWYSRLNLCCFCRESLGGGIASSEFYQVGGGYIFRLWLDSGDERESLEPTLFFYKSKLISTFVGFVYI